MSQSEQIARFLGFLVAATIAGFVAADARRRGLPFFSALGWGAGVLLALIVFLPLYLWLRNRDSLAVKSTSPGANSIASVPCPYCDYANPKGADYCGKCGRQLKKSTEIHR